MFWGLFKETFLKKEYMKVIAFILVWMMAINAAIIIVDPGSLASYATDAPVPYASFDESTADVDYTWYTSGSNSGLSMADAYVIKTPMELVALAKIVNGTAKDANGDEIVEQTSFEGKYIKIEPEKNDSLGIASLDLMKKGVLVYESANSLYSIIDASSEMNCGINFQSCSGRTAEYGWEPIGKTEDTPFAGIIYTEGNVNIYNLSMIALERDSMMNDTDVPAMGLFGYLSSTASVSGIHLKDVALYSFNEATEAMGALAGVVDPCAEIINCSAQGLPSGERNTSGGFEDVNGSPFSAYTVPNVNMYSYGANTTAIGGLVGAYRQVQPIEPSAENTYNMSMMSAPEEDFLETETLEDVSLDDSSDANNDMQSDDVTADSGISKSNNNDSSTESTESAESGPVGTIISSIINMLTSKVYADTTDEEVSEPVTEAIPENDGIDGDISAVPAPDDTVSLGAVEESEINGGILSDDGLMLMSVNGLAFLAEPVRTTHTCIELKLENITVAGMVLVNQCENGEGVAGGIVGSMNVPAAGAVLNHIVFRGELVSYSEMGTGCIIGYISGRDISINDADVAGLERSVSSAAAIYLSGACGGGIIGRAENGNSIIEDCKVAVRFLSGSKKTTSSARDKFYKIGGIIGAYEGDTIVASTCNVTMTAIGILKGNTTETDGGGIGGIAGYSGGKSIVDNCCTQLRSYICADSRNTFIGGILGKQKGGNQVEITNCSSIDGEVKRLTGLGNNTTEFACIGGMVGGFDDNNSAYNTSKIENCNVENWKISGDALIGGILGLGKSGNITSVKTINNCTVAGFEARSSIYNPDKSDASFLCSGGIAPAFSGNIEDCVVTGCSFSYIVSKGNGGYFYLGGICGRAREESTIRNCVADVDMEIAYQPEIQKPFMVGGIAGSMERGVISSCGAILEFDAETTITSFETYSTGLDSNMGAGFTGTDITVSADGAEMEITSQDNGEYFAGGLVGQLNRDKAGTTEISDSFSTGHINLPEVTVSNASGGIVAYINNMVTVSMSGVFSTVSISSEGVMDAQGGLVGASFSPSLNINNAWFGGTLLQPWAGAVLGMSRTYSLDEVYVNNILAPQRAVASLGPGATGESSIQSSKEIPSSIAEIFTSDTGLLKNYYEAAAEPFFEITDADGTVAFSNAFSLASGASWTYNNAALRSFMALPQSVSVSESETQNVQGMEAETISERESTTQEALGQETITVMGVDSDSLINILLAQDIGDELDMPALLSISMEDGGMSAQTYETLVTKPGISIKRTVKTLPRLTGHDDENGTEEYPYEFSSAGALDLSFSQYVSIGGGHTGAHFVLAEDCNSILNEGAQVGNMEVPFFGTFDGKGHALALGQNSTGFFSVLCHANIENMDLIYSGAETILNDAASGAVSAAGGLADSAFLSNINNVHVYSTGGALSGGSAYAGGLIGIGKSTVIQYSSFTGTFASAGSNGTGGIIGRTEVASVPLKRVNQNDVDAKVLPALNFCTVDTPIVNSYVAGDIGHKEAAVESTTDGSISAGSGSVNVGGILGYGTGLGGNLISECFMLGNTYGYEKIGGLAGNLESGNIARSYTRGDIYAVDYAGGVLGYAQSSNVWIINAYFAGQLNSYGNMGAACGNGATVNNFSFDSQLAGNIPTLGNEPNNRIGSISGEQLDIKELFGAVVTTGDAVTMNITYSKILELDAFANIPTRNANNPVLLDDYGTSISLNRTYDKSATSNDSNIFFYDTTNGVNALNIKLPNNADQPAVTISFTGTEFTLKDRPTGQSASFSVFIDGYELTPSVLTGVSQIGNPPEIDQNLYSGTFTGSNGVWTVTGTAMSGDAVVWGANSNNQTAYDSFSVSGLSNSMHTVVIEAQASKNKYLTFYGFSFKCQSIVATPDDKYPQLPAMMASFGAISQLSATRLYDFGEDIKNNAYHIRKTQSMAALTTAAGLSYEEQNICPTSGSAIEDFLHITSNGDKKVYTNVNNEGGGFDAVETWNTDVLKGYNLSIKTQIRVVPFEGEGSLEDPFKIPDVKTLVKFRNFINRTFSGRGQYYALTMTTTSEYNEQGYIYDLSNTESEQISQDDSENWSPIGTASSPFAGYFLGNNKQISNLSLTSMSTYTRRGVMEGVAGLFGYVRGGSIQDLIVSGRADLTIPGNTILNGYAGMLVAAAENENISNIAISSSAVEYQLEKPTARYINAVHAMGGMVGYGRNTKIDNAYVNVNSYNISMNTSGNKNSIVYGYGYTGGVVGKLQSEMGEVSSVERALVYTNLTQSSGDKITNARIGGIVGALAGNGTVDDSATLSIKNSAAYGCLDVNGLARVGGIVGRFEPVGYVNNTVTNCSSTADIYNSVKNSALGGIVGEASSTKIKNTISDCMYAGTIHANPSSNLTYIGGISRNVSMGNTINSFDKSKNYDIYATGTTTNTTYEKTTSQLSTDGGLYYDYDSYLRWSSATPTFLSSTAIAEGSSGTAIIGKQAEQILKGQNMILYIVRASKVRDDTGSYNAEGPEASSVYVRGEGAEVRLSTPSGFVEITNDSKRAVSTETNKESTVQAQAVLVVTGEAVGTTADAFGGYGKIFRYFPSTRSTGRLDASYLIANPEGDGIENETADGSFTLYTADQLMGLGLLLESKALTAEDAANTQEDGVGGIINSNVYGASAGWLSMAGRTIYMGRDISFDTSNYINAAAYISKVAGTSNAPFMGIFDGKNHLISERVLKANAGAGLNVGGIFGYVRGQGTDATSIAAVKNVAIVNSLISLDEAGAKEIGVKSIGSLVGTAENAHIENVFSTARVEQPLVMPQSINMGGIAGTISGGAVSERNIFDKAYFTGTIGQTAVPNEESYMYIGYGADTSDLYMGAIAGRNTGFTTLSNAYAASYIVGYDVAGKGAVYELTGGGDLDTSTNCYFDKNAGAEHYTAVQEINDLTAGMEDVTLTGFVKPLGMYPVLSSFTGKSGSAAAHVTASAIPVDFSVSAYSLVKAELGSTIGAVFDSSDYEPGNTHMTGNLYSISNEGLQLDRVDNGLGMVKLTYTESGLTASRTVGFYMQCWYDNYTTQAGIDGTVKKVYTIHDKEEMEEFALLVKYGDDPAHIGHNHIMHNGTETEDATFVNAIVKLGDEIVYDAEDQTHEPLMPVGSEDMPFYGVFDGCGYGFVNPSFTTDSGFGIFGCLGTTGVAIKGEVKNTYVRGDVSISLPEMSDSLERVGVGILVDKNNGGAINNCFNAAAVFLEDVTTSPAVYFGAIVGENLNSGTIDGCYNMAHITALNDGMNIGGLVGYNEGSISNSYNTGVISGYSEKTNVDYVNETAMGGIAALSEGPIEYCYNAAVFEDYKEDMLNPIANITGQGSIENCYMDSQFYAMNFNGIISCAGITAVNTNTLTDATPISGWNSAVWNFSDIGYYPMLSAFTASNGEAANLFTAGAGHASALAVILNASESFDSFSTITMYNGAFLLGTTPASIAIITDLEGNKIRFAKTSETSDYTVYDTVEKDGRAYIRFNASHNGSTAYRDCLLFAENRYTIQYKIDFSELIYGIAARTETTSTNTAAESFLIDGTNNALILENSSGSGISEDPYIISSIGDMSNLAAYVDAGGETRNMFFKLINHLNYDEVNYRPIGTGTNSFNGNFNGNGYNISNITNMNVNAGYTGIFGKMGENSSVELLALKNCRWTVPTFNDNAWAGLIAGYCGGNVSSCFAENSALTVNSAPQGINVGGIVGELTATGSIKGAYVKGDTAIIGSGSLPQDQIDTYFGGVLVGKNSGNINGCYTYASMTLNGAAPIDGVLAGVNIGRGTIENTYFFYPAILQNYPLWWNDTEKRNPQMSQNSERDWSLVDFRKAESATEDSAAMLLSQDMYLGTYEMPASNATNNGFPVLAGFELVKYDIPSFEGRSNLIVNIKNIDASISWLLNAMAYFGRFEFPVYAEMAAKQQIYVNLLELPADISFNPSVIAYGTELIGSGDSQIATRVKASIYNGEYATAANSNNINAGGGAETHLGAININLSDAGTPMNVTKICVYLKLKNLSEHADTWGVRRSWNSVVMQQFGSNEEIEE